MSTPDESGSGFRLGQAAVAASSQLRTLLKDATYIGGIFEMAGTRLYGFWGSLTEGLRTGQPQNEAKHGDNFFAKIYDDPQQLRQSL